MRLRKTGQVVSKDRLYTATGVAKSGSTKKSLGARIAASKAGSEKKNTKAEGKRFKTGPFIITTLKKSKEGMRPVEVAQALSEAAPGAHKSAISVVNTTLARLKEQGHVVNKDGVWSAKAA